MNSKIELIDEYIKKCETCTECDSRELVHSIVSVFGKDIKNLTDGLDSYDKLHMWEGLNGKKVHLDYFGDIKLLQQKLTYYKSSLEYELEKLKNTNQPSINLTQNQTNQISIIINFEQTISAIESIPDEKLSQDEKELLEGKLSKINTEKDKSKLWKKAQSALKWIADKGIEVGIAALPYIAETLKNAK